MRLTKKELLFLNTVTFYDALAGSFDFENNNGKEFKESYGLTKEEVEQSAISIRNKMHKELQKYKMKNPNDKP